MKLIHLILFFSTLITAYDYDLIVIGGGAAGLTACKLAAAQGKSVLLIEKNKLGGGRIWSGDIPFNTLFRIAEIYHHVQYNQSFGIEIAKKLQLNSHQMFSSINTIQTTLHERVVDEIIQSHNISTLQGKPYFVDNHTIFCQRNITADKFIIATGARPYIPQITHPKKIPVLTKDNFFSQEKLPDSMIMLGCGPIAIELGSALSHLGVEITLIMQQGMILPSYDLEIIERLTTMLADQGIKIHCGLQLLNADYDNENDTISLTVQDRAQNLHTFTAEKLFLASQTTPNIEGLELENAGVTTNLNGIRVDKELRTTAPNIWACGTVVGRNIINHLAYQHAKIAVHNMFRPVYSSPKKENCTTIYKNIYTIPPVACIGLTEEEALKLHGKDAIAIYRCHYNSIERSYMDNTLEGVAKFICTSNGKLIGVHILGAQAHELINFIKLGDYLHQLLAAIKEKTTSSPNYYHLLEIASTMCQRDMPSLSLWDGLWRSWKKWLSIAE